MTCLTGRVKKDTPDSCQRLAESLDVTYLAEIGLNSLSPSPQGISLVERSRFEGDTYRKHDLFMRCAINNRSRYT